MDSPEQEPGGKPDETQHQVTVTEGFWLADTACTQQLWQAVMGSNPSLFSRETLSYQHPLAISAGRLPVAPTAKTMALL